MRSPFKKSAPREPKPAPFTREELELERRHIVDSYNKGDIQMSQLRERLAELKALEADLASPPGPPPRRPA